MPKENLSLSSQPKNIATSAHYQNSHHLYMSRKTYGLLFDQMDHCAITNLNEANSQSKFSDVQYLIMGSEKGEIQLLDINTGKLYSHFVSSHTNAVNDLCWNLDTLSLFSCSTDKTIGIWDMISGKLKAMWEADEEPLHSICVIDNDNLLAASTSVTWWNIKEQTVIKSLDKVHWLGVKPAIDRSPIQCSNDQAKLNLLHWMCCEKEAENLGKKDIF
ncbi:WD repeat-containing protein 43 [Trichonephila inaurata madagascariensis]|uniref:WD repeat-containing protein 43 n=1 Tax=Trichonephila inaurata madagascariensis TaxID=2747483 RepID=A0A8X7C9J2_9ARAC|nr:WD repeat-containing protein 43 [Trichonephila inaurata madagascariensis]